jgi:hypothetical protein
MPQKVEIDGVEKNVYSEEEVKAVNEENVKQKELLTKLHAELGVEGEQSTEVLFEKLGELKDSVNPNFKAVREVVKNLKTALKEKGVEVDESTGQIRSNSQNLSMDEINKAIKDEVKKMVIDVTNHSMKESLLSGYNSEDRGKIEPVLDKLMTLGGSLEENLDIAEAKVFPGRTGNSTRRVYNSAVGGGAPASAGGGKGEFFADSTEGKELGGIMGLKFAKEKPKS